MPESYVFLLIGFGVLVLLTAWLPMVLSEAPLSLPIVCVALGALIFAPQINIAVLPPADLTIVERFTELVILISLMGAALKIDRKVGWQSWMMTWRLLAVAMPATILILVCLGQVLLGLSVATALVLAAALAPTDPVLASDVQVGPPKSGEEDDARFALTSEAGLNDGLAFPFIMCAIALAQTSDIDKPWFVRWFAVDVMWRLTIGVGVGVLLGYILGWLVFRMPISHATFLWSGGPARLSLRWSSKMPPQDEGLCVTGASDPRIARAEGRALAAFLDDARQEFAQFYLAA